MDFNDVYLVNQRLEKIAEREIQALCRFIDPLPSGYESFLSTFGHGVFCNFISLWEPKGIERELIKFREEVRQSIDWFKKSHSLPEGNFAECVPLAMSVDGDYIVVCPDRPRDVFAIPRHDFESIYQLPEGLNNLLFWERLIDRSTNYVSQPPFYYFESFLGRSSVSLYTKENFNLSEVAGNLYQEWSNAEIREIRFDEAIILFPRAIDGRVQITQSGGAILLSPNASDGIMQYARTGGKTRIGIDIGFDWKFLKEVNQVVSDLEKQGFFVTSRT